MSDLDNAKRRFEADVLLPFFGLSQNLGPMRALGANIEGIDLAAGPAGLFAIGDVVTYPGKLKLILSGFAEAAAAHAFFLLVHRGEALHFECSTAKGISAAS